MRLLTTDEIRRFFREVDENREGGVENHGRRQWRSTPPISDETPSGRLGEWVVWDTLAESREGYDQYRGVAFDSSWRADQILEALSFCRRSGVSATRGQLLELGISDTVLSDPVARLHTRNRLTGAALQEADSVFDDQAPGAVLQTADTTHPEVRRAIEYLSARCDGAESRDNEGFSKADAAYGHRMAVELEERELTGDEQIVIRDILVKYTGTQLTPAGIRLPDEPELKAYLGEEYKDVAPGLATRGTVLGRLRKSEAQRRAKAERERLEAERAARLEREAAERAARSEREAAERAARAARGEPEPYRPPALLGAPLLDVGAPAGTDPSFLTVRFARRSDRSEFAEALDAIKRLPTGDRRWSPAAKMWFVRTTQAEALIERLAKHGVNVSRYAVDAIDRARVVNRAAAVEAAAEAPRAQPEAPTAAPEAPDVQLALGGKHVLVTFRHGCRDFWNYVASVKAISTEAKYSKTPAPHWELPIEAAAETVRVFPNAAGVDEIRAYLFDRDEGKRQAEAARIERLDRMLATLGPLDRTLASGVTLRPFQQDGVRFLLDAVGRDGQRGALVGDDMGLGKSLQALIAAKALAEEFDATIFVVTKASLLDNWANEARQAGVGVEIFSNHFAAIPTPLDDRKYIVLIDESHAFKSLDAKKTGALMPLVKHPNCVAAFPISGTLGPNGRSLELLPALMIIDHEVARDAAAFRKRYGHANQTTIKHKVGGRIARDRITEGAPAHLVELNRRIRGSLLRRTKEEVSAQLPEFVRNFMSVELSAQDYAKYRDGVTEAKRLYLERVAESERRRDAAAILRATAESEHEAGVFTREEFVDWLRTMHPGAPLSAANAFDAAAWAGLLGDNILEPDLKGPELRTDRAAPPARLSDEDRQWAFTAAADLVQGTISREGAALVALTHARKIASEVKVPTTIEMMEELIDQGRRPLVFTEFRPAAERIAEHFGVRALTGETAARGRNGELGARQQLVDDFNKGRTPVFVGTISAGGEGLNITGGADVILHDRGWTPGLAQQVEARSYRMGQQAGTVFSWWMQAFAIDKKMDDMLQAKHATAEVLYTGEARGLEGNRTSYIELLNEAIREVDGVGLPEAELAASRREAPDPVAAPVARQPVRAAEPDRLPSDGTQAPPLETSWAAIFAQPRLQAPHGAASFDHAVVRESHTHSAGMLVLIENPAVADRTGDRWALLDVRRFGDATFVHTLMVVDGEGRRSVWNEQGLREQLSTPEAGAARAPLAAVAALAAYVDAAAPNRDPDGLLSQVCRTRQPAPGFETPAGHSPVQPSGLTPVSAPVVMRLVNHRLHYAAATLDRFRVGETHPFDEGAIVLLENPTAIGSGEDRWIVAHVSARDGQDQVAAEPLMAVDGDGRRSSFDATGARLALPGAGSPADDQAATAYLTALEKIASHIPRLVEESKLAHVCDVRKPAPDIETAPAVRTIEATYAKTRNTGITF